MKLDKFFPYRLAITAETFSRQLTEVYARAFGLSREEWRLLFLLADIDEISSSDLAQKSSLDKVQVSRAAERLATKGLINKATSPVDRRLKIYGCTDAGRALFNDAFGSVNARSDDILNRMSAEDRAALERGIAALAQATEAALTETA